MEVITRFVLNTTGQCFGFEPLFCHLCRDFALTGVMELEDEGREYLEFSIRGDDQDTSSLERDLIISLSKSDFASVQWVAVQLATGNFERSELRSGSTPAERIPDLDAVSAEALLECGEMKDGGAAREQLAHLARFTPQLVPEDAFEHFAQALQGEPTPLLKACVMFYWLGLEYERAKK